MLNIGIVLLDKQFLTKQYKKKGSLNIWQTHDNHMLTYAPC